MTEVTQTLEQAILDLVRQLPLERQKQALDFVRSLEVKTHKTDEDRLLASGFSELKSHLMDLESNTPKEELKGWLNAFG
jgi:hypothetical protein